MSTKFAIVSTLMFSFVLTGISGIASATSTAKDTKKKEDKKPAVTWTSISAIQKTVDKKKKEDKKKSADIAAVHFISQSSQALNALAYQPTQWKPTSYMGGSRQHCPQRTRAHRRSAPAMIG